MKFIIGKKIEMTQIWRGEKVFAVTKVQAGPCPVVQLKTDSQDGYSAVQLGYGERKEKNIKKSQVGHLKKAGIISKDGKNNLKYLSEFRGEVKDLKVGDMVDVSTFAVGDKIKVTALAKGKGFQGVVKRHGFSGQDKTHGNKDQLRMPGSIGATGPQHVFKGVRMPGRMGGQQVTVQNLEIIDIDKDNNILLIKGAVPGGRNSLVLIKGEGELIITRTNADIEEQTIPVEEKKEQEAIKVKQEIK